MNILLLANCHSHHPKMRKHFSAFCKSFRALEIRFPNPANNLAITAQNQYTTGFLTTKQPNLILFYFNELQPK